MINKLWKQKKPVLLSCKILYFKSSEKSEYLSCCLAGERLQKYLSPYRAVNAVLYSMLFFDEKLCPDILQTNSEKKVNLSCCPTRIP